jgi:hypothetical protein
MEGIGDILAPKEITGQTALRSFQFIFEQSVLSSLSCLNKITVVIFFCFIAKKRSDSL